MISLDSTSSTNSSSPSSISSSASSSSSSSSSFGATDLVFDGADSFCGFEFIWTSEASSTIIISSDSSAKGDGGRGDGGEGRAFSGSSGGGGGGCEGGGGGSGGDGVRGANATGFDVATGSGDAGLNWMQLGIESVVLCCGGEDLRDAGRADEGTDVML